MALTKRQNQILNFLKDFLERNNYSPTLEEIAEHFGMASLNGVYKHLKALEERGAIKRLSNQARSIQILSDVNRSRQVTLKLEGTIAAGRPIEAMEDGEEIGVPESFLTRGHNYVLRVSGDSMIEDHIQDGDLVVVESRQSVYNGETVVALIDGEDVTLKKYYREGNRIRLQPANSNYEPIIVDEQRLRIQGVVTGVMRRY